MSEKPTGPGIRGRSSDAIWLAGRVARKVAYTALPVSVHFVGADLRRRLRSGRSRAADNARQNLQPVLGSACPASELDRIVRKYSEYSETSYLWRHLLSRSGHRVSSFWPVTGVERLNEAREQGRGVILLTAHLGHPELISKILELHGYKARRVIADLPRPGKHEVDDWLARASPRKRSIYERTRIYVEPQSPEDLPASLDARPILKALADRQILVIAGDGFKATGFARLSLLGHPYPFPTGFMKIALMTRAVVLPAFAIPEFRSRTMRVEIGTPLPLDPSKSVEANLQCYADVLEGQIRATPHLWARWGRRNWFQEANKWADQVAEDPFTSKPAWLRSEA